MAVRCSLCSDVKKNVSSKIKKIMFSVDSLDTITEGSTLVGHGRKKSADTVSYAPAVQDSSDDLSHRFYEDPSMSGRHAGHLDSRNTRLTVQQKHVHYIGHANEQNRNMGDYRRGVSMKKLLGDSKKKRADSVMNTQPVGCNGPVICKLGVAMQGVMIPHDVTAPVYAAPHMQFSHGGIATDKSGGKVSMIGAGGTVPGDTPKNMSLNNAVGLHYAMKISPASAYVDMRRQKLMQGITTGAGS